MRAQYVPFALTSVSHLFIMYSFLFLLVFVDFLYLDSELIHLEFRETTFICTCIDKYVCVHTRVLKTPKTVSTAYV